MRRHAPRLLAWLAVAGVIAAVLIFCTPGLQAGNPRGALYSPDTNRIFWFVQASDLHIGTSESGDSNNLRWLVTTARTVVNPSFIVVTGDLTDSTNGNWLGWPDGPHQEEWNEYKSIVDNVVGLDASNYYDLPGNHDAYSDRYFAYYLANSVQGRATGRTQHSWTRQFPFGKYHFLGVNTAGNTGAAWSLSFPWGDSAGLDASELTYIGEELTNNADARLTMAFGHHPVTDTGGSTDTWLFYGQQEFIANLDLFRASAYGYGHTHANADTHFTGNTYTGTMVNGGIRYPNVDALGKDSPYTYRLFAIDCDGVSSVTQPVGTWPVVMITAPVSKNVGSAANPYTYPVYNVSNNPIRALVFDAATVSSVSFRIDSAATWQSMARVSGNTALWNATWDASALASGPHTIEVRAVGTTTRSHVITVDVSTGVPGNQPPVARDDAYNATAGRTLTVGAPGVLANDTDAEGTALAAEKQTNPANGTLTLSSDGGLTYTPTAEGTYSFTYLARDEAGATSAPATVTFTVAPPDTVTITSATWSSRTRKLSVTATSSAQPSVTLTLYLDSSAVPAGTMLWSAKKKTYTLSTNAPTKPASVTVKSTGGGTATRAVS